MRECASNMSPLLDVADSRRGTLARKCTRVWVIFINWFLFILVVADRVSVCMRARVYAKGSFLCGAARRASCLMGFRLKCISVQPIRSVCLWEGFNCNWCNLSEPPTRVRPQQHRRPTAKPRRSDASACVCYARGHKINKCTHYAYKVIRSLNLCVQQRNQYYAHAYFILLGNAMPECFREVGMAVWEIYQYRKY